MVQKGTPGLGRSLYPADGGNRIASPRGKDYFAYGQEDSGHFDVKHLAHTLCISDEGDEAVLLLNPMVVWPDGEWETWFFANWLPGATRYRSFADWMRHELADLRDETFQHSNVPGELPIVYLDGPAKADRRVRPREEILTFDEVLQRLASKTRSHRIKAIRQLARIGGQQSIATLLSLLKSDYNYHVRCEAADMLGRLRVEEAIEPLIAITEETSHVTSSAVQALGYFSDEASAQRLQKLIEEDGCSAGVAVYALARRGDARGVPALVQKLVSKDSHDQHTGNIAGRYIAQFERPGFVSLEPLATHDDVEIRRRAINGIFDLAALAKDRDLKIQARDYLKRLLEKESDQGLRRNLEVCIEVACRKKP